MNETPDDVELLQLSITFQDSDQALVEGRARILKDGTRYRFRAELSIGLLSEDVYARLAQLAVAVGTWDEEV